MADTVIAGTDLTTLSDSDLDALRVGCINEQERRANVAQMPLQAAIMTQVFVDAGGVLANMVSAVQNYTTTVQVPDASSPGAVSTSGTPTSTSSTSTPTTSSTTSSAPTSGTSGTTSTSTTPTSSGTSGTTSSSTPPAS